MSGARSLSWMRLPLLCQILEMKALALCNLHLHALSPLARALSRARAMPPHFVDLSALLALLESASV
jgi:hypothetical protein